MTCYPVNPVHAVGVSPLLPIFPLPLQRIEARSPFDTLRYSASYNVVGPDLEYYLVS